ncbi:MAG: hypothetical protein HY914_19095 [Desulfomonile tiedjei]|nr:hypothetical protein [Desulfomonile tiedjei]
MRRAPLAIRCCLFVFFPLFWSLAVAYGNQEDPRGHFGFGAGPASIKGGSGADPQIDLASLGLGAGVGCHALVSLLSRMPSAEFRITGEYLGFIFSGDASYSGAEWTSAASLPPPPQFYYGMVHGDPLDASLAMNLAVVSADWLFGFGEISGRGTLTAGPRLEWLGYYDEFIINNHGGTPFAAGNITLPCEFKTSRAFSMLGMGLAGSLDIGPFSGGRLAQMAPRLAFSGVLGAGNGMRFGSAEGFVELLLGGVPLPGFAAGVRSFASGLAVQAGYLYISLVETRDEGAFPGTGAPAPGFPGPPQTKRAQYQISYPEIRLSLAF